MAVSNRATKFRASLGDLSVVDVEIGSLARGLAAVRRLLQAAVQLEHATLPPYLTALYSLKPGVPWEVIEIFRSVAVEEMLHLTLAANVLNAVGGDPVTCAPGFVPDYPSPLPLGVDGIAVGLLGFSRAAVAQGLAIERPGLIAPDKVQAAAARLSADARAPLPRDLTIGEFYALILGKLHALTRKYGERAVFSGDPARQIGPDLAYYEGGGHVLPVTDLAGARTALDVIRAQGEGSPHDIWTGDRDFPEVAHYYRFAQIEQGRMYAPGDTARSGPTGPAIEVPWDAAWNVVPNAKMSMYAPHTEVRARADAFNRAYGEFLATLQQALRGRPDLLMAAVPRMFVLKDLAAQLMRNPLPGREEEGLYAAPTFELVAPADT